MRKVSNTKVILGITAGTAISFMLAILMVNVVPFFLSEYVPIFLGALVASFIIKEKPWLTGIAVAVAMAILSLQSFLLVIFSTVGSSDPLGFNINMMIALFLYLPSGLLGSYCGSYIKRARSG